jgi:hypothetical protein
MHPLTIAETCPPLQGCDVSSVSFRPYTQRVLQPSTRPPRGARPVAAAQAPCCSSASGARRGPRAFRSHSPARRARTRTCPRARARSSSPCARISLLRQDDNDKEGALVERELVADARVRAREKGERVGEEAGDGLNALGQAAVRPPPRAARASSAPYKKKEGRRTSKSSRPGPRAPRSCSRDESGSRRRPRGRSARSRALPRACP